MCQQGDSERRFLNWLDEHSPTPREKTMAAKKLERAIDRLLKRHREYYQGWRKAWLNELDREEMWDACRALKPGCTREEFDRDMDEFIRLKTERLSQQQSN